jgi:hypothetical protein
MKLFNIFNWVQNLVEAFTFYSGGGGGGQTSTGTTYTSNLPEYAKPFFEQALVSAGKNVYTTAKKGDINPDTGKPYSGGEVIGVKPMPTYTGERVAGFTPGQEAIQRDISGLTTPGGFADARSGLGMGSGLGYGTAGVGLTRALGYTPRSISTGTFSPAAASYYMSPYATNVSDIAAREARRQGDILKQQGAMGSIGRGTFGGARQALLQAEQERGVQQNIGDIYTKGQQAAYENAQKIYGEDTARSLQAQQANQQAEQAAASLAGQTGISGLQAGLEASRAQSANAAATQTAELERLKTQAASEGEKQALQQKINDIQYQQAMEARDWEKKQLEFYNAMLRGNAGLAQTQIQYAPTPSGVSQLGGLGLGALGLSKALG